MLVLLPDIMQDRPICLVLEGLSRLGRPGALPWVCRTPACCLSLPCHPALAITTIFADERR